MNIPNFLTLLRILLIPLLVILLMEGRRDYALLVFIAAGVSDGLDGFIARVFKQKTQLGAFIDPIADKLLIGTSYVTLAILDILPGWLAVLVVSRDVLILMGLAILILNDRDITINPVLDSKLTTLLQLLVVIHFLGKERLDLLGPIENYFLFFTAAMTLFSGFHYIFLGFRILGTPNSEGKK